MPVISHKGFVVEKVTRRSCECCDNLSVLSSEDYGQHHFDELVEALDLKVGTFNMDECEGICDKCESPNGYERYLVVTAQVVSSSN